MVGALVVGACGGFGDGGGVTGAPGFEPPGGPPGGAPTGEKWLGVEVEDGCGRLSLEWVLVDEVCGATDAPDYLESFRAPMFRDGARVGDLMYAVDATHLWVLDVADPEGVSRQRLEGALGEPLAVAEFGGRLLIAAGSQGLLMLDLADPLAPTVANQIALPGPALDVYVYGGMAYVATGASGVTVVDLSSDTIDNELAVPGYAAAVAARDGLAYVAACGTFAIIDETTGQLVSQTWLNSAYEGEILRAPAKDVALVDDVAFVAAGRYGAVAIDVFDATDPTIRGFCTEPGDMSFYASGVRANADALYIAGGEWGVKAVPMDDPLFACGSQPPSLAPLPEDGAGDCSQAPPWDIVPWVDLWSPPPPSKDPIQTLPHDDVVYAFGDARRIGTRAIDIKDAVSLDNVGRYDEPRLVTGIAAFGSRVFAIGPAGGVFEQDPQVLLIQLGVHPALTNAVAVGSLADGRWIAAEDQAFTVEGAVAQSLPERIWSNGLAVHDNRVAFPLAQGALLFDVDAGTQSALISDMTAVLPQAIAFDGESVVLAAPEWTNAVKAGVQKGTVLPSHGVFDVDDVGDANRWRIGLPRRLLTYTAHGMVEIASLGGQAGLALHGTDTQNMALPAGTYSGAASAGDRLYLVSADRNNYRSQLLTVDLSPAPSIVAQHAFTGQASGVAVSGDRIYVADADRGIRVYDAPTGGEPAPLGLVALEEVTP